MTLSNPNFIKGRGAQIKTTNKFHKQNYVVSELEAIDEEWKLDQKTEYLLEHPKKIINKVTSPDINLPYSMNPYQGCEHGCVYCYARNTHEYYGYNAGLDFESRIMVKENAATLLKKQLSSKKWIPDVIMLSGNTDCYQPAERKFGITRQMLKVLLEFKHPVGIITKNHLIQRDLDILTEMAKFNLVHVNISITSLKESIRLKLEPRTATAANRLNTIKVLSDNNIPVRVMAAPMIPFINSDELINILKASADKGALDAGYTIVRLNGSIAEIFSNWLKQVYPDKWERVLGKIKEAHGGRLNDSRFGKRMRGEGKFIESVKEMYKIGVKRYFLGRSMPELDFSQFSIPPSGQLALF